MDLREALRLAAPSSDITRTLINDAQECARNADNRPWNQFWKRMYVRSAYSMIEGINNFMKQSIYSYHETSIRPLHEQFRVLNITPPRLFAESQPESELLLLLEKAVSLKPNGLCHTKDAFTPTDASIRFMFEMHKRVFQTDYTPDFAVKGWNDLKVGLLVRHRLTHPKNDSELHVTEEEANTVQSACQWFLDQVAAAGNKGVAVVKDFYANLHAFLISLPKEKFLLYAQSVGHQIPPHLWTAERLISGPENESPKSEEG